MPSRRTVTLLLLLLLALVCAALPSVLLDGEFRHVMDSAIYVLTGQSLAAGNGYRLQGEPFFLRPPGLAWMVAPLIAERFDPADVTSLNLFVQCAALLAVVAVAVAMSRLHGAPHGLAVALLFALGPTTVLGFNRVLSEFPHMALFYSGAFLLLPSRATGRAPGWGRGLCGALLVGASCWFRNTGLLLLPALVLAALSRRRAPVQMEHGTGAHAESPPEALVVGRAAEVARAAVLGAVVIAAMVPWTLAERRLKSEASVPATQNVAYDLPTALLHADARDPRSPLLDLAALGSRVADNAVDLSNALAYALVGGDYRWARIQQEEARERNPTAFETSPQAAALALLVAACVLGTALLRRSFLDWYALAYLLLLLVWTTFVQRLLLPVVPMLLSSLVTVCTTAGERLARRARRPWLAHAPVALISAVLAGLALANLPLALSPAQRRDDKADLERDTAAWIVEHTVPDAVLLHERGALMALLSGRRTYTWRHLPGPWPEGCPPVDWAFYGPRDRDPEVRAALDAEATEHTLVPMRYGDRKAPIHIYRVPPR